MMMYDDVVRSVDCGSFVLSYLIVTLLDWYYVTLTTTTTDNYLLQVLTKNNANGTERNQKNET